MSDKATDKAKANTSSSSGAAAGHDLDHDPDVARKTSRAGLKQAAAAQEQSSTPEQREAQGAKANASTSAALDDAAAYAAKEMLVLAHQIDAIANAPDDAAGWTRRIDAIDNHISIASSSIGRLRTEIGLARAANVELKSLHHSLAAFEHSYTRFETAVDQAAKAAQTKNQVFAPKLAPLEALTAEMYQKIEWTAPLLRKLYSATTHPVATDDAAHDASDAKSALGKALRSNVTALSDSTQKARMNVTAMSSTVDGDVGQVIAHYLEVEKLYNEAEPKSRKTDGADARQVLKALDQLIQQVGQGSQLATRFQNQNVPNRVHKLLETMK